MAALGLSMVGLTPPALAQPEPRDRRRIPIEGPSDPSLAPLDDAMVTVLHESQAVGGSLAVAKNGRLVHSRGYGWANRDQNLAVTPRVLFCIGSVTKAITGVTVLRLVESGRLSLEDHVVERLGELIPVGERRSLHEAVRGITVRHLLNHSSGLPDSVPGVERLNDPPDAVEADRERAILGLRKALTHPLAFPPGTKHKYCNLGFIILRLVIEQATGGFYEPYVRHNVLSPLGLSGMRLEGAHHSAGETLRYADGAPIRQWNAANWLATPANMARFLCGVAGTRRPALLKPSSLEQMVSPPPPPSEQHDKPAHFGLGWDSAGSSPEGGIHFSKNGAKAGVQAYIAHRSDGISWAAMFNSTHKDGQIPASVSLAPRAVTQAFSRINQWPEHDLWA